MPIILDSIDDFKLQPMTDRERELIHYLRTLLKDLPNEVKRTLNSLVEVDKGERWTDSQLLVYLNQAVADLNSEPPHTAFSVNDFPESLRSCVTMGAMIFALIAESILQVGETFSYSDNGISLNINLAQGYQNAAQMLLSGYLQLRKNIKTAMRPTAAGIKSAPAPVRIRSYAPRMWVYR